jgi:hypothetical protein
MYFCPSPFADDQVFKKRGPVYRFKLNAWKLGFQNIQTGCLLGILTNRWKVSLELQLRPYQLHG